MTEHTDQEIIDGEHNCRTRVRDGHAELVEAQTNMVNPNLKYKCDVCGRSVYEICEVFNIQVEQREGKGIMEPPVKEDDLYTGELVRR